MGSKDGLREPAKLASLPSADGHLTEHNGAKLV
jgi:hypothetical protein